MYSTALLMKLTSSRDRATTLNGWHDLHCLGPGCCAQRCADFCAKVCIISARCAVALILYRAQRMLLLLRAAVLVSRISYQSLISLVMLSWNAEASVRASMPRHMLSHDPAAFATLLDSVKLATDMRGTLNTMRHLYLHLYPSDETPLSASLPLYTKCSCLLTVCKIKRTSSIE